MKKILTISLLSILLLSSCSIDWNDENTAFKKKQECASYKNNIEKSVSNINWKLEELFYSKSRNSCIYIMEYNDFSWKAVFDYMSWEKLFDILNQYCWMVNWKIEFWLTKDKSPFNKIYNEYKIETPNIIWTDKCKNIIDDKYEKWIKELKWE